MKKMIKSEMVLDALIEEYNDNSKAAAYFEKEKQFGNSGRAVSSMQSVRNILARIGFQVHVDYEVSKDTADVCGVVVEYWHMQKK